MSEITITLPDERWIQLKEKAADLGITPEQLVSLSVEELLARSDHQFRQAVERVLDKNQELYKRLA
jgi:hypothetical protein